MVLAGLSPIRVINALRPMIPRFVRHGIGRRLGKIRSAQWNRLKGTSPETTVLTRQGTFVVSTRDEVIGRQLYVCRQFELDLMREIVAYVRQRQPIPKPKETFVIDIGANIGSSCIAMVGTLGWTRGVAVEPDPYNFDLLKRNIALNGLVDRIVCVNCAASFASGTATLTLHRENFGDHRLNATLLPTDGSVGDGRSTPVVPVTMRAIDDIIDEIAPEVARDIAGALLWMDVQGHERFALEGATRLIERGVPTCVELWPYGLEQWGGGIYDFTRLANTHWDTVVRFGPEGPSPQPIRELSRVIESLGAGEDDYDNVLFMREHVGRG